MADPEWVPGDMLGLPIPAHPEALRIAGQSFLTEAFRASGALPADNRVVGVTRFEDWPRGSTGRAPALIQAQIPDLTAIADRFDPRLAANETARVRLHMMTTFLHLWDTQDFGNLLSRMHRSQTP
jgi:hypothetical protein